MATVTSTLTSHLIPSGASRSTAITPPDVSNNEMSLDSNDVSNHSLTTHQFSVSKLSLTNDEDNASCCSDDTVLSVGNENPVNNSINGGSENLTELSFKNIQNHLNAISAITTNISNQNLTTSTPSASPNFISTSPNFVPTSPNFISTSPSVERLSPSSAISCNRSCASSPSSPSSYVSTNGYTIRHSNTPLSPKSDTSASYKNNDINNRLHHHHQNQNNNNNLNNSTLKFSIDNILKADFGRRITDPINIKKGGRLNSQSGHLTKKLTSSKSFSDTNGTVSNGLVSSAATIPVDLSKSDTVGTNNAVGASDKSLTGVDNVKGASAVASSTTSSSSSTSSSQPMLWPAWVYCTRYSDRPSSGRSPRSRRSKKSSPNGSSASNEEKRPRTAFSGAQLARLKHEFAENRYLTERRRQQLSAELGLNEAQIKIWFQNKRAKIKKASGQKNPLALQLMAQGLYNHSTVPLSREEEELQQRTAQQPQTQPAR